MFRKKTFPEFLNGIISYKKRPVLLDGFFSKINDCQTIP